MKRICLLLTVLFFIHAFAEAKNVLVFNRGMEIEKEFYYPGIHKMNSLNGNFLGIIPESIPRSLSRDNLQEEATHQKMYAPSTTCENAIELTVTPGLPTSVIVGNMDDATISSNIGITNATSDCKPSTFIDEDLWYKVKVPSSGEVFIETFITGGDTYDNDYSMQIYSGDCESGLTYIDCSDDDGSQDGIDDFMPAFWSDEFTPDEYIYIRILKDLDSRSTFAIAAYDPSQTIPLSEGDCIAGPVVEITMAAGNAYRDVPLLDSDGYLVAELYTAGVELGDVQVSTFLNTDPVRHDGNNVYYLDRNFSIDVENQPSDIVLVYLYYKDTELNALKDEDNEITSGEDLNLTAFDDECGEIQSAGSGVWIEGLDLKSLWSGMQGIGFYTDHFTNFFPHGGNSPLPVTLIDFETQLKGKHNVLLSWTVVEEINLEGYVVEKSTNGQRFTEIGKVQANNQTNYQLIDQNAAKGINYYRLKMVDKDNSFKRSEIRKILLNTPGNITLHPNPTSDRFFITGLNKTQTDAQVSIYNEIGELIWTESIDGRSLSAHGIDISTFSAGAYHVKVKSETITEVMRLVKH